MGQVLGLGVRFQV